MSETISLERVWLAICWLNGLLWDDTSSAFVALCCPWEKLYDYHGINMRILWPSSTIVTLCNYFVKGLQVFLPTPVSAFDPVLNISSRKIQY